ncbi:IclR family transcriptional regulator [Seohaeicola saemankumensis]|nr:IclR family transcriptional regulator [Seohaeicola saemankumensis]
MRSGTDKTTEPKPKRRRGRPRKSETPTDKTEAPVLALDRGLRALTYLAESRGATLADIADNTRTPVATTYRILKTLQARGMAEYSELTGRWVVGSHAFHVGNAYLDRSNIVEIARATLGALAASTGETVNLAVEEDGNLVYVFQVESNNPVRAIIKNGETCYLHSSGIGKALMAYMDGFKVDQILTARGLPKHTHKTITSRDALRAEFESIRQQGWAIDDEERFIGMRCVAAPLFNSFGNAIAGISISGPTARFSDGEISAFSMAVTNSARLISEKL